MLSAIIIEQLEPGADNFTGNHHEASLYAEPGAVGPAMRDSAYADVSSPLQIQESVESDLLLILLAVLMAVAGYCSNRWRKFVFMRSRDRPRRTER